jgi:hypothetical protein
MIVEARIANAQKMSIVWLPLHRIFGQGIFPIFQCQRVLKDTDPGRISCQRAFPIEQEISKARVPGFRQRPRFANCRESAIHIVRLKLLSRDPTKDFRWRMTAIFPFLCKWKMKIAAVAAFIFRF